jgi:hypothetical protein
MADNIKILPVVYMGGTCGDLITAMIDMRSMAFDAVFPKMKMPVDRQRLKKPHTFSDDTEKDKYLNDISMIYTSIPSHDIDYHVKREHRFMGIRVKDINTAVWAAKRFQNVHRPQVWQSVSRACNIDTVEQYAQLMIDYGNMISQHTSEILELEDIVSGQVIPIIENIIGRKLKKNAINCYCNWQHIQNRTFVS